MPIRFRCPGCGRGLKAGEQHAGREIGCPSCGAQIIVPSAVSEPKVEASVPTAPRNAPASSKADAGPPIAFSRRKITDDEVDMTPMVDVVFQLLIFFMVTAAFSLQKSIAIPPPESSQSAVQSRTIEELEQDDDFVIVRIDRDNMIWVDDSEAPSEQELLSKLRAARAGPRGSATRGPSKLLVLASGDARHERVVMALDAGTEVGMEDVRLATADDL